MPAPKPPPAAPKEPGWLPDCVYTGEKFETGLAFFADALGRITRFSREPADLAMARRLPGQAALPGLVNGHSESWRRLMRGRVSGPRADAALLGRLTPDDVFETARMAFTEMLLSGITCVGEFHDLPSNATAEAVLRAAHEAGIRLALFPVAPGGDAAETRPMDAFLRDLEQLRVGAVAQYPADEAWLGAGMQGLAGLRPEALKAFAAYAHAQRLRLHVKLAATSAEAEQCRTAQGRTPLALLADAGMVDKRLTAIHGIQLSDEECRVLGTARAAVCACPVTELGLALGLAPIEPLLGAGAGVSLGTAAQEQIDLMKAARLLEYALRSRAGKAPAIAPDPAKALFHAATVAGARSLGATGGALEVGRPADFFTVNLFEPSLAGSDSSTLLANVVFALERRAIREVWVGARQRVTGGRHPNQGLIVGRFVEMQRRLWA